MSINNYIPTIWAARLMDNLQKALVFGQPGIINRDWEGEIKEKGDTVRITGIGAVTISDYVRNTNISAAEAVVDASTVLTISQQKYFNFQVDNVDAVQDRPQLMNKAMQKAAYGVKDAIDQYIAALYTDAGCLVGASGSLKTFSAVTDAYGYLVDLGVVLSDAYVPTDGRWVIVPPWFEGLLLKDDRFVKSGAESGAATLANGKIGTAAGFSVYVSPNVSSSTTTFRIMAGDDGAITFADGVQKLVAYTPELRFADAIKGLSLYGAKVVDPNRLACLYCTKPTALVV